ncbi:MAG: hypothetical protein ACXAEF_15500, partial [Candidatus Thorarchaeota archaeon]
MRIKCRDVLIVYLFVIILSITMFNPTVSTEQQKSDYETSKSFTNSDLVWSEDFDEGISEDWEIIGINWTESAGVLVTGNFSLDGGVLRATGPEMNFALRNSSVVYGT